MGNVRFALGGLVVACFALAGFVRLLEHYEMHRLAKRDAKRATELKGGGTQ
jgi:hypothetical protein